ncbi:hypothetical protein GCM10010149_47800 [Nonomuraea roseoviolacea subsp. roseoviolacea]
MSAFKAYEQYTEYGVINRGGLVVYTTRRPEEVEDVCASRPGLTLVSRDVTVSEWTPVEA